MPARFRIRARFVAAATASREPWGVFGGGDGRRRDRAAHHGPIRANEPTARVATPSKLSWQVGSRYGAPVPVSHSFLAEVSSRSGEASMRGHAKARAKIFLVREQHDAYKKVAVMNCRTAVGAAALTLVLVASA